MSPVTTDAYDRTVYRPGQRAGHYESFYQRGNHPSRPLAFWIRYTLFSPQDRPADAVGELWAIVFDGETGRHVAVREEYPIDRCTFDRSRLAVRVPGGTLGPDRLTGAASSGGHRIGWDLSYGGGQPPLYLLPRRLYDGGFPKAKNLVGRPLVSYDGQLDVDGRPVDVTGWVGAQAHNWGSRHTDHYAFGQVAGFDDAPEAFLEVVSAQVRLGPVTTPLLTFCVLRHDGQEHSLVSFADALRAKARFGYFDWDFRTGNRSVRVEGRLTAPAEAFVGLTYANPPGGAKQCLNTKLAAATVTVTDRASGSRRVLSTRHRALFEILTDDREHGIPMQV